MVVMLLAALALVLVEWNLWVDAVDPLDDERQKR